MEYDILVQRARPGKRVRLKVVGQPLEGNLIPLANGSGDTAQVTTWLGEEVA